MSSFASLKIMVRPVALIHTGPNLTAIALYVANILLRGHGSETMTPLWPSIAAVMLPGVSGWLGGKMVYVHGVGVQAPPRPPQQAMLSLLRRSMQGSIIGEQPMPVHRPGNENPTMAIAEHVWRIAGLEQVNDREQRSGRRRGATHP
jgi:hypothetical protein